MRSKKQIGVYRSYSTEDKSFFSLLFISHRSLKTVTAAPGFDARQVEVFTPKPHEELAAFLKVVGLPLTVTHQLSPFVATLISMQFGFAFRHVLAKYPEADLVVVLEEDIEVSPDFFV